MRRTAAKSLATLLQLNLYRLFAAKQNHTPAAVPPGGRASPMPVFFARRCSRRTADASAGAAGTPKDGVEACPCPTLVRTVAPGWAGTLAGAHRETLNGAALPRLARSWKT